jgi:hypothetical protein
MEKKNFILCNLMISGKNMTFGKLMHQFLKLKQHHFKIEIIDVINKNTQTY